MDEFDTITHLRIEITRLQDAVDTGAEQLAYIQRDRERLEDKLASRKYNLRESEERGKQLVELQNTNKLSAYQIRDLTKALEDKDAHHTNHIDVMERRLKDKDTLIDILRSQIADKNEQLEEKDSIIRDVRAHDAATWLIEEERVIKKRMRDAMNYV